MTLPPFVPIEPKLLPRRPHVGDDKYVRPLSDEEIKEFLEDTKDLQDAIDLWDQQSRIPGLLDATIRVEVKQQAYTPVETYFDLSSGVWRYIRSNYRVPASRVRLGVMRISKYSQGQMRDLTAQLVRGEISREQWYGSMRKMMKDEYRAAYLVSIGGKANYDRSEVSRFGWKMRPHYRWLNNFLDQLNSGAQPLNGFAVVRAGMYGRAGNSIYQNVLFDVAERNEMREGRRILGPTEDHCEDSEARPGCIELSRLGWVPLRELVPIGDATCYTNCLCWYEFRK